MKTGIEDRILRLHEDYYRNERMRQNLERVTTPGSQYVVQLVKGGCLGDYAVGRGRRMLDVGCGSGFNMISFAMMGWEVHGCEISDEIVQRSIDNLRLYHCAADVVVGENEHIPFPDEYFDFVLSLNVIHYVLSDEGIGNTVREYSRILREGGRILLITNHPANWLLKDSESLGGNLSRINCPGDYRHGEAMYTFPDRDSLMRRFEPHFSDCRIGENQQEFFTKCLRHFVLTGVKK